MHSWSKKWGLSEMGFGREKTVYTYFAVAATSCLPYSSIMRLVVAKAAIIVTVADDFYDMNGSLTELENLTDAVKRCKNTYLNILTYMVSHSDALNVNLFTPILVDGMAGD